MIVASCGAKSDLDSGKFVFDGGPSDSIVGEEAANSAPEVTCPPETYAAPTRPALLEGSATDDGWIAEYLWAVESGPAGSTAAPSPANSPTTSFRPDMAGTGDSPVTYTLRLTATDNTGLTASCTTNVLSVQGAPVAICPENQNVVSGSSIDLEGDAFDDGSVVRYLWEIVSGPPGYTSYLENGRPGSSPARRTAAPSRCVSPSGTTRGSRTPARWSSRWAGLPRLSARRT
jgi:hypothetical protein